MPVVTIIFYFPMSKNLCNTDTAYSPLKLFYYITKTIKNWIYARGSTVIVLAI